MIDDDGKLLILVEVSGWIYQALTIPCFRGDSSAIYFLAAMSVVNDYMTTTLLGFD